MPSFRDDIDIPQNTPPRAGHFGVDANRAGDDGEEMRVTKWVTRAGRGNLDQVSSLSAFTRRMEQYPQLPAAEQARLATMVRDGRAARERLLAGKYRSESKQRRDDEIARAGDNAANMLVGSNFRLVILICRELAEERHGRERAADLMADLVGEANVALVEAIIGFDETRCPVFATYAARVVRDKVRGMLGKDGPIRLPPSWHRLKRIAAVRIPQLQAELGRAPSRDEIHADLLERCLQWAESKLTPEQRMLPAAQQRKLMDAKLRKQGMFGALDALDDVLQTSQGTASLDASVGDDSGTTLGDLVVAGGSDGDFDGLELEELRGALAAALAGLDDREREILLLRYGFVDGEQWTYGMIGEKFNVTAERIRQIERAVLTKLRGTGGHAGGLRGFLPGLDDA